MKSITAIVLILGSAAPTATFASAEGGVGGSASAQVDPVSQWNAIAVKATVTADEAPLPQTRTLAMVQLAIHDALNAIDARFERYAFMGTAEAGASVEAAIAAAARDAFAAAVIVAEGPGFGTAEQQAAAVAQVDKAYAAVLAEIPEGSDKANGVAVGQAAAAAIVALRNKDHAADMVPYIPGTEAGDWQPTPNPIPFDPPAPADLLPAGFPGWGRVTPFALRDSTQFEPAGPPDLTSSRYARDFNEVKAIGEQHSTTRTADQSAIARFWYEASGASWSRIASVVAQSRGLDTWQTARLLALVNVATADGFIAGFQAKYDFNFWRPVTAIRFTSALNPETEPDFNWSTLLDTPNVPDYPSTHSVLGGAASQVLRRFFRRDDIAFTTTSGVPFPGLTRSFSSFSQAARQNGDSRVFCGIHFRSAVEDGIREGTQIGRFVFNHILRALERDEGEHDDRDRDHNDSQDARNLSD